jgi:hypothetical protein
VTAAQPWALLAFALAIPIVIAYLHRRRRLSKQMPSVLLLRAIAGQSKPTRRAWSRPRHLVSLAFVLLALAGLAVALADLRDEDDTPRDWVVVLDTSASMGAGGSTTRLDDAIDALDDALATLRPGDRVALVTTGAQTLVRVGLTEDRDRVLSLARATTPAGAGTGSAGALRIADAICKGARRGAIVFVSDGVGVDVPTTTCPIEHVAVGRGGPNAGITALSVREADALGLAELYTVVTSELGRAQEIELTLKIDDDIVDVISLDLPAHGDVEKLHRVPLPPGERVTAQITHLEDDQLAADDTATVVRHGGARVSVLLVAETRLSFAAEALRLHPRVDLRVMGPHDAATGDEYDLVVLETEYLAGTLPKAPKVVAFGVPPQRLGVTARAQVETPEVIRWSFDHPLFRFVDLTGLELPRALALVPAADQSSLVDSDQGSLALTGRWDDRELVYVGFLPHESDLVLRVGFVNFVANLVEWAAPAPPPSTDDGENVLSKVETTIDPPAGLDKTVRSSFAAGQLARSPLWTLLLVAALGALVLEWLLPAFTAAVVQLRGAVARRRRKGGAT